MKKLIIVLLLSLFIVPFAKADTLYGFADGQYYNSSQTLEYICFLDGSCLKSDGTQTTREALGLSALPTTTPVSSLPANTPTTTYVPVYIPSDTGANNIAGGEPQATVSPISIMVDPSFTATSIPATGTQVTLGQWVVSNSSSTNFTVNQIKFVINYTGTPNSSEGFNNLTEYINGAETESAQQALYNTSPLNAIHCGNNSCTYLFGTNNSFSVLAGNNLTLSLKGDPLFGYSTNVNSILVNLESDSNSGNYSASGTSLSIVH